MDTVTVSLEQRAVTYKVNSATNKALLNMEMRLTFTLEIANRLDLYTARSMVRDSSRRMRATYSRYHTD